MARNLKPENDARNNDFENQGENEIAAAGEPLHTGRPVDMNRPPASFAGVAQW